MRITQIPIIFCVIMVNYIGVNWDRSEGSCADPAITPKPDTAPSSVMFLIKFLRPDSESPGEGCLNKVTVFIAFALYDYFS